MSPAGDRAPDWSDQRGPRSLPAATLSEVIQPPFDHRTQRPVPPMVPKVKVLGCGVMAARPKAQEGFVTTSCHA